ncbi:DUF2306 domain-containing protein [Streptomyces sp. NBC_01264]|uniref:DUF2306 domain-containing protein n=1 Tax=Streptomyces sp. NBC_01264 TaxID=2903804 RepID=UPI0022503A94|nr:DUF2306 domain-containing protein [Streptomyces sp. NBC_01264]MCX4783144.1 DUF2306 domain-containing protein [Streptomyces sp. NBC_01264]
MNRLQRVPWARASTIAVVAVCVVYAPVAMTELWSYARPGAPAPGEWILGRTVSPAYVAEALRTRVAPYGRSLVPLIVHSVLGGALMLLGPVQLLSAVRRRPRLHRAAGVVFAVTVYASMAGAAVYLVRTAPEDAFSGPTFWIALATILVGTTLSVTFGILAALGRFPDLHQRWMLLCYGYLMTAPLLRLEWGALPRLLPGLSMEEINRVATMHLGSVVVFGALLASRTLDRRGRPGSGEAADPLGGAGTWVPFPALVLAHLAGGAALAWIGWSFLSWGTVGGRLLLGYLVPYAATFAVMTVRHRRAGRRGDGWAREEWRLHLTALCLAPLFSLAAAVPFDRYAGLDRPTALIAGVAIGCGVTAFAATAVVSLRVMYARELVRRAGPAFAGTRPTTVAARNEVEGVEGVWQSTP